MKWHWVGVLCLVFVPIGRAEVLTPSEVMERVESQNADVGAARVGLEQALNGKRQARAGHLPRLGAGSSLTRGDGPVYVFGSLLNQRQFTQENFALDALNHPGYQTNIKSWLRADVPVFTGFELRDAGFLADLGVEEATGRLEAVRQSLRFTVVQTLLAQWQADERGRVLSQRIVSAEREIASAERLRDRGLVLGSDFFAAQAVLTGLRAWQVATTREAQTAQETLTILLKSTAPIVVQGNLAEVSKNLPPLDALLNLAKNQRADVLVAKTQTQKAGVVLSQENSSLLPRVDAMAQVETNTDDFSSNPSHRLVMVEARWFLGDPARASRREGAQVRQREGQEQERALADKIDIEIRQAWGGFSGAQEVLPVLNTMIVEAKKSLEMVRPLYRQGRQSLLDVIRAEEALAQAENQRLQTLCQMQIFRARALRATGTLDKNTLNSGVNP